MDLVLFALFHHFGRRQRWAAATAFFKQLASHYNAAAVYVAASLVKACQSSEAVLVLEAAAEQEPFNAQVWTWARELWLTGGRPSFSVHASCWIRK